MNLEELQKLPYKWWKKDKKYIPCEENLLVDFEGKYFSINYKFESIVNKLEILNNLDFIPNFIPGKFEWFYAINTELMEYLESYDPKELADIAIFCALCLKYYYQEDLLKLLKSQILTAIHSVDKVNYPIYIEPVYSWLNNPKQTIVRLLLWSIQSSELINKINYNKGRQDHAKF